MELKVKKLYDDAKLPTYGTDGAACFDLYALYDADYDPEDGNSLPVGFSPTASCTFGTGLSFEIPQGYAMMIYSRSGHGFKNGIRLSNCVGCIDSDYRGEVKVKLQHDVFAGDEHAQQWFEVKKGDRIAQAMLVPVDRVSFIEVDELTESARGKGGFGSTGS